MNDREHFESLCFRARQCGLTPIVLVGAGHTAMGLRPTFRGHAELLLGVIDDDPAKVGLDCAGLPVLSFEQAMSRSPKTAIITAEGSAQDTIWRGRGRFRERGMQVFTCPARFPSRTWDDCLIDQYEHGLARAADRPTVYLHEYPAADPTAESWLLDPLLEHIRPGMAVCEIGSGAGLWTQHVIERAGIYHAVDYSPRLLYEAIEHRFCRHLAKLQLHHDESASLAGVPDHSIDLLFSFDVFVHFKSDLVHQFLAAAARVLKPDGLALIHFATWNDAAVEVWQRHHAPTLRGQHSIIYYNHMDWLTTSARSLGLEAGRLTEDHSWGYLARFRTVR